MSSRFLRRSLIVATTLVTLALMLVGAAHLPFVRARVLDWARARVSRDFGVVIDAEGLSYNLLEVSIELRNLSVSAPGERPFLQADGLRVVLDRRLFAGTIDIQRIELVRPRVAILRHRDGSTNLPTVPSSPSSKPTPLHLGIVSLAQVSFDVEDESGGHKAAVGPTDLTFDTRTKDAQPGRFGPSPFNVVVGFGEQVVSRSISGTFGGRLGFDGERLTMSDVRIDTAEGRLALNGGIDVIAETIRVDARGRLDTDLARAGRLIGNMGDSVAGSVAADVTMSGLVADPTVHVVASARNLQYLSGRPHLSAGALAKAEGRPLPSIPTQSIPTRSIPEANVQAEATYASGRVEIQRFDLTSELGTAGATGTLQLTANGASPGANQLHAHVERVDIDRVLDVASVHRLVKLGSAAAGDVDVALNGQNPFSENWWRQLTATGSVLLAPTGAGLALEGQLKIGVNGDRWTVEHQLRSKTGPTTMAGVLSGQANRTAAGEFESTLAGQSRVRIDALHALTPLLQQAGIELPESIKDIDGSVDAVIDPRGTLAAPRARTTVAGRDIRLPDFPEGQLDATLTIDRRAARAESLQARTGTTSLTASGTYSWSGQVDSHFDVAADDLHALARLAAESDLPVSGSARLVGTLQGTVQSPRGRADLSTRDLSAYEVSLGSLSAQLRLANNTLEVDAQAPDLSARLQGSLAMAEPYRFQAEATLDRSSIAALLPASMRDQVAAEGSLTTSIKSSGTLMRPWDSSAAIALRAFDGKVSGVPIVLDAPATVSVAPEALTASALALRVGEQTHVQLSGTLGVNAVRDGLSVHADGPLSDWLAMAAPAIPDTPIEARESKVSLDLHVGGTLLAPQPSGTLTLAAASLRYADQPPLTDVAVDARIEATRVAVQSIAANWRGARLQGNGTLPLRMILPEPPPRIAATGIAAWGSNWLASLPAEPRSAAVSARMTGISTDALAPFVDPSTLKQVSGSVDATLSAEADAFRLERVRGSVVLDEASLIVADVPFTQSVPTRIRLDQGQAHIEEFRWNAESNELRVTGGADLLAADRHVDLAVDGDVDLRILSAFASGIASGGIAHSALTVKGPIANPEVLGTLEVRAGELRIDTPPFAVSDLEGTIAVPADRNATIALKGTVNGGAATVQGNVSLANLTAPTGRLTLTARNVTLDYPEGLQTESNADLVLTLVAANRALTGHIDVLSGLYREPLVVSRAVLSGLGAQTGMTTEGELSFLSTLSLDVGVGTAEQIRVDNNYGRLNLMANLQVTGTALQPGAVGRIEAEPDGEIYLAGNTYRVESLVVDLTNSRTIAPDVSFLANTLVGDVPVEVALQCSANGACEHEVRTVGLSSEEAQATEAKLFGLSGNAADAGAEVARLLSGELLGVVGQSVGLDTLRLEQTTGRSDLFDDPTLIAGDVNPASRLTIGKRLGDRVELAYSQNLAQNGFTMSTSYFAPGGISVRALLLDDQSRTYEFRHEPRFGAPKRKRAAVVSGARIAGIRFTGTMGFPENDLRRQLHATVGDRFAFTEWQADRERLIAFYQSRGFYEVHIRARRLLATGETLDAVSSDTTVEAITLEYDIERGRPTRLEISGFTIPDRTRQLIIKRWSSAVFDGFLERDATLIAREYLYAEHRLQATVASTIERSAADDSKTLRVTIDPGRTMTPRLVFEGNTAISTATLMETTERSGPLAAWLDPASFAVMVARLYRHEGLLSAEVNLQPPQIQEDVSVVRVVIREGEPWTLGRISVDGAGALGDAGSIDPATLSVDGHYTPKEIADRIAKLEQQLRDAGFLNAHVTAEHSLDPSAHRVNVHAIAEPGPRTVLTSISVEGSPSDREAVARNMHLTVGAPLSASELSAARRSLYEAGSYRSVDIDLVPVEGLSVVPTGDRNVVARIHVEQRPRYSFRYGLAVNDNVTGSDQRSREIGVAADLENRNVLDLGATLGLSARIQRDREIGRMYLSMPRFFDLPLQSTLFLSRGKQNIGSDGPNKTVSDITEITAQQTYRLRKLATVSYGYSLARNRTTLEALGLDLTVRIARLNSSAIIERRNDPFDPTRGWFTSGSFELSRPGLGSELSFLRSFFQQFQFMPLGRGIVFASAARVGLARTYRGETLIPSERFFSGGATSVRGYADDALGARSVLGDADGGAASLIGNSEMRFPIYRWLRGVGFVDLGNVYPTVYDLLHSGVQVGAGAGFRLNTPVGLLRLDFGVPVNPRPLDPAWTVHFGLGHAF